ncbi:MAG: EAL domain-containing protein, partial [Rubrivivax sp.]|nr:EAL domain-containing protein [Rubrivivax sp.]
SPLLDAKVMMVDDEPLMTELIQTHLEDAGYRNFVVTHDPREALDLLRREEVGVLLLDLMMPQMSGFDLLQAIRADRDLRYTPVIVLTATTGADAKLRALQLGATDFLSKPVDASELGLRVRNTLAYHQYHKRQANLDGVTGLPNQRLFDRGLAQMVANGARVRGLLAHFSITVPECLHLRESLGQGSADELTKVLARRLEKFATDESVATPMVTPVEQAPRTARLAADQFGLLIEGIASPRDVEALAQRLVAMLAAPVTVGQHDIHGSAWVGIALSPTDGIGVEALRKGADLAARQAQQRGMVRYQFASADLNAQSLRKMTLGLQLRGAAGRGELELHYQPKLSVVGNRMVGCEALVRWNHPEHGLMPPGEFIFLAEELGLICEIGTWVMGSACREAAAWAARGLGHLKVAVNVSKRQFQRGDLCACVQETLRVSGLAADQLVLELTESMLMDDVAGGLELMHALTRLGVTLSIDDFGTGYSSLNYLKHFPLSELKIDRSFITDLPGSAADVAIVRAIIDLGHNLGMSVVAEGIETTAQLACLQQFDCDHYQGYLYSKPLPAAKFAALLADCDRMPVAAPHPALTGQA